MANHACATPVTAVLFALLVSNGCSSLVLRDDDGTVATTAKVITRGLLVLPTFGVSEKRISRQRNAVPISDGFHYQLTPYKTTIIVVGNSPFATNTAVTWLQKRGIAVVERTHLDQLLAEQRIRLAMSSDEDAALFKAGRLLGASEIVFVDSYQSSVAIRSVDLETGKIGWTGSAHYRDSQSAETGDRTVNLTCQALATAWGFRETGDRYILSQEMCGIGSMRPQSQSEVR